MRLKDNSFYAKLKRNEYCKLYLNSYDYQYINENVIIPCGTYLKFSYKKSGLYRCTYGNDVYIHITKANKYIYILYHGHLYPFFIATEFTRKQPKEKIDRKKEYLRIKSEIDRLQQEKEQLFIR